MPVKRAVVLLAVSFAIATPARADGTSAASKKRAAALFDEGRRLIVEGRFDEACTRFAESERLYPSSGTLLNLVDCHERNGLLASALATCHEAERLAHARGDEEGRLFAQRRAEEIAPKVPSIAIELPPNEKVTRVAIDGTPVELTGKPLLVDAGRRRVEITLDDGSTRSQQVDVTADARARPVRFAEPERVRVLAPPPPPPPPPRHDAWKTPTGVALGAVGGAALVLGAVTGVLALSKKSDLVAACSAGAGSYPDRCGGGTLDARAQQETRSDLDTARTEATISTAGIAIGAVFVAAGVVLYLLGRSDAHQSAFCPTGMPCFLNSARR
jgi:hypothetical protein